MGTAEQNTPAQQLLFYREPIPLSIERHSAAGLTNSIDFSFSKATNSVPITIHEFIEVCKTYPIVFANTENFDPVAVLGFENNKNLFVSGEGNWVKEVYVPAYVRRYPFAFMSMEDKLILCVDEASKRFVKKAKSTDMKFFEDKDQSSMTKSALEFCTKFHTDQLASQSVSKLLNEKGLLIDKIITFNSKEKPLSLSGFKIIDEEKLRDLDPAVIAEWHKTGILSLVYMHLMSLSNFDHLARMVK